MKLILFLTLALVMMLPLSAFGQLTNDSVIVTTDKASYSSNDVIVITGEVRDLYSGTPISIIVKAPKGNVVSIISLEVGADKKFSTEITAGGELMKSEGIYYVVATYGTANRSAETSFEFGEVTEGPENTGVLGSEHSHANISVNIFGDLFDFSAPAYQIKSSWIHFEERDGSTVHKHATGVTLGYLFETLSLGLDDQCFVFQDGRSFCTNEDYVLSFFVNGEQILDIINYEIVDYDTILISYGATILEPKIPGWVKNIFVWYANDLVSETELLNAIEYLINEGTIKVGN